MPYKDRAAQNAQSRKWRAANPNYGRDRRLHVDHGLSREAFEALWRAQDGRCYLCGNELSSLARTHIDHDHSCCPPEHSCRYCRRGLAHRECNQAIGLLGEDSGLMRKVAANLEIAMTSVRERIATKPLMEPLW